jgi:Asp-tRNA(Asn)/Glu-tRNA(Gln) amidotransferase A subunit family amidase
VYRLYDDFSNSFTASLLQKQDGSFETLSAQIPTAISLTIGVPSRLYYTRTKRQPLAGVRIGVKDLYSLKGVRRSNGNRAWYHLYPPSEETSPAIQRLVDAGAVVVGYQGLAQFANGDTLTADWVDFHSPFNPRGDGYQVPSGSSSGAGASIASYEWLDVAVGSDTGGSVRNPAQVAGVFGNRPTHGAVSLALVTPLAPSLDTAGLIVRDPWLWDAVSAVMYRNNYTSLKDTERVAYPDRIYGFSFPGQDVNETVRDMVANFTSAVGKLADAEVEILDMDELWNKTRPEGLDGTSLLQLLNTTYVVLTTMEQSRLVRDPFFTDYAGMKTVPKNIFPMRKLTWSYSAAKHNGRKPYINPSARGRWSFADTLPQSEMDAAYKNQTILTEWFTTHVLARTNDSSCSSAFLLYPGTLGKARPRDTYRGGPSRLPYGLYSSRYSSFSGTPDIALPIGEISFMSDVTGMEEPLPVSMNVMAARGCDGLLTRLAMDLVNAGMIDVPKTGRGLDGGEILFRRDAMYGF